MAWQKGPKITNMRSLPPEQLTIRDKADTAQRKHTHTHTHTHTHAHTHTHTALRAVSGMSHGWRMHTPLWVCVLSGVAISWLIHSFYFAGLGPKVCTHSSKMQTLPQYDVSSNHLFPLLLKTIPDFREQHPFPPATMTFLPPKLSK